MSDRSFTVGWHGALARLSTLIMIRRYALITRWFYIGCLFLTSASRQTNLLMQGGKSFSFLEKQYTNCPSKSPFGVDKTVITVGILSHIIRCWLNITWWLTDWPFLSALPLRNMAGIRTIRLTIRLIWPPHYTLKFIASYCLNCLSPRLFLGSYLELSWVASELLFFLPCIYNDKNNNNNNNNN